MLRKFVHRFGFIYTRLYRDALSTKHKNRGIYSSGIRRRVTAYLLPDASNQHSGLIFRKNGQRKKFVLDISTLEERDHYVDSKRRVRNQTVTLCHTLATLHRIPDSGIHTHTHRARGHVYLSVASTCTRTGSAG